MSSSKLNGVKMLPFAILSGEIKARAEVIEEVRITEIAQEGLTFRTANTIEDIADGKSELVVCLHFYNFEISDYEDILFELRTDLMQLYASDEYSYTYIIYLSGIEISEEIRREYSRKVSRLFLEYSRYIRLKLEEESYFMSEGLVGYPGEEDYIFETELDKVQLDIKNEVAERLLNNTCRSQYETEILKNIKNGTFKIALALEEPQDWKDYIEKDIEGFLAGFCKEIVPAGHIFTKVKPERIYVGNQFCMHLMPDAEELELILKKAEQQKIKVTVCTSFYREEQSQYMLQLVRTIDKLAGQDNIEVVANDWGLLEMIAKEAGHIEPVFGILLNRWRKDSRYVYAKAYDRYSELLRHNNLECKEYREYLKERFDVTRFEVESVPQERCLVGNKNSLHIPTYQTNTSHYCPLLAKLNTGDRGKQRCTDNCGSHNAVCLERNFAYPTHLKMTGRWNSIFGYDASILYNAEKVKWYAGQGVDRLVLHKL